MVTPPSPDSPASITPLLLLSAQTLPAIWPGGISPKLFSTEAWPTASGMLLTALGSTATPVAVPPLLPARVWPLSVPAGWVGSRTL